MKFDVYAYNAWFNGSRVDHTYVKFENEETFKCAGGDRGGEVLSDASGEQDIALARDFNKEMSIPVEIEIPIFGKETFYLPTGDTGIIYGVNGVCHMMANRIICPSGKTVHNAKGYLLSSALFGTYGTKVGMVSEVAALFNLFIPKWVQKIISLEVFINALEKGIQKEWEQRKSHYGVDTGEEKINEYTERFMSEMDKNEDSLKLLGVDIKDKETSIEEIALRINTKFNKLNNILKETFTDNEYQEVVGYTKDEEIQIVDPIEFKIMTTKLQESLNTQFALLEQSLKASSQYGALQINWVTQSLGDSYLIIKDKSIDPNNCDLKKGFDSGKLLDNASGLIECRGNPYTTYGINGWIEFELFHQNKSVGTFTWNFDSPYFGVNQSSINPNLSRFYVVVDDNGNAGSRDGALGTVTIKLLIL